MADLFEFSSTVETLAKTYGVQLSPEVTLAFLPELLNLLQSRSRHPNLDREIELFRYFNVDDQPLLAAFQHGIARLSQQLGQLYYVGEGERYGPSVDYRGAYFFAADQALEIALWQREAETVTLMLTGHDADSLLTLTLGLWP
jgi:hypothetical protein